MTQCFTKNSLEYYDLLSDSEKTKFREIVNNQNLNPEEKIKNGEFTHFLSFNGFKEIIEKPKEFLDGKLFDMKFLDDEFTQNANKTLNYILLALSILHDITSPLHNIREYTDFEKQLIISSLVFRRKLVTVMPDTLNENLIVIRVHMSLDELFKEFLHHGKEIFQ